MTDRISVILASRGRPASLNRTLASLVAIDSNVEVMVGLDDDDETRHEVRTDLPGVRLCVNPFPATVGALYNILQKEATGDWFVVFPDDYTVVDEDWADRTREAVKRMPCSLGVAYLKDVMYPGFTVFPVVSRRTIEIQGFYMPEFFPFLYCDTWWNEIGNMCGVKQEIDALVQIDQTCGHEHRYRDFLLWANLFEETRPMRVDTSIKIVEEIYKEHDSEASWLIHTMPNRAEMCAKWLEPWRDEKTVSRLDNTDPRPVPERYLQLKSKAEKFMEGQRG